MAYFQDPGDSSPFDYLFDNTGNITGGSTSGTVIEGSGYVEPDDPAQAAGALLDNIVFPRNNRRSPIFKDSATASAYEAGLRDFMKATGRTDMDPYGVSGRFYYPGIDRRGDPFSTNNRGMTQESIDSINRLAYNQYLGLISGKGFRKGGEGDPVPGYAPALKLGSDTPMGKVVADPNVDAPSGILGILGRGNVPRVLDDMGVNYSTQGIDAAMGDPVNAVVSSAVSQGSPTTSDIADAAANAKVFGGDADPNSVAAVGPTVAEILLNDPRPSNQYSFSPYTGPFTSQTAEDIYMSGADTPVGTFTGGTGTGDTGGATISSRSGVRDFERSLEDLERSGARSDFLMDMIEELRRTNPLDEPMLSDQSLIPSTGPTDLTAGVGEELLGTRSTAAIDRTDDPALANVVESIVRRGPPTTGAEVAQRNAETNALMQRVVELMESGSSLRSAKMQAQAELNRRRAGIVGG